MPIDQTGATREYGRLLDDVRRAMSDYLGDLYWLPRQEADRVATRDGRTVLRIGPDFARAVRLREVTPRNLSAICNKVLARHGFPEQPVMTGSESGHLTTTATDGRGAQFHFFCKADLEYWVDLPVNRLAGAE